jgi:hypothetical protein
MRGGVTLASSVAGARSRTKFNIYWHTAVAATSPARPAPAVRHLRARRLKIAFQSPSGLFGKG